MAVAWLECQVWEWSWPDVGGARGLGVGRVRECMSQPGRDLQRAGVEGDPGAAMCMAAGELRLPAGHP